MRKTYPECWGVKPRGAVQRSSSISYGSYAATVIVWKDENQPNLEFTGDTDGLLLD